MILSDCATGGQLQLEMVPSFKHAKTATDMLITVASSDLETALRWGLLCVQNQPCPEESGRQERSGSQAYLSQMSRA